MRHFTPSPAMVIALVALFVALGGTSYAAITALPKNSVGAKQLKDGAVTAAKINSSVAGAVKVVGSQGAPAYEGSWEAAGEGDESVSFYKDAFGVVHLQGSTLTGGAVTPNGSASLPHSPTVVANTIFTLPSGDRPAGNLWFAAYGGDGSAAYIEITSTGAVTEVFGSESYIGLGNITFRAGV
ncbi:MAG TPA: hypothetical protein VGH79_12330 [Gaiellaceae bacterium]|jgi:hypothetical protein